MLKEFAEYLANYRAARTYDVCGERYIDENGKLSSKKAHDEAERINTELLQKKLVENLPETIEMTTLEGIKTYLETNPDLYFCDGRRPILHVMSPSDVRLYAQMDALNRRPMIARSRPNLPRLTLGGFLSQEDFIIQLQSKFVPDDNCIKLLRLVSALTDKSGAEAVDNGITQTVTIKKGVATLGAETIPNPIALAPFRTFAEARQAISYYTLRIDKNGFLALFDSSGGGWEITAIQNIIAWFRGNMDEDKLPTIIC